MSSAQENTGPTGRNTGAIVWGVLLLGLAAWCAAHVVYGVPILFRLDGSVALVAAGAALMLGALVAYLQRPRG